MTVLWLGPDGMSHYHHMVRHEIYLLYINDLLLKQLHREHSCLNGQPCAELSLSFWVTSMEKGHHCLPMTQICSKQNVFELKVSKL